MKVEAFGENKLEFLCLLSFQTIVDNNTMHLSILLSLFALCWCGTLGGKNSDSDEGCCIRDTNLRLQFLGGYTDPTDSSDECYEYRIHSHYKSGGGSGHKSSSEDENSECQFDLGGETEQSLQWSLQICNGSYDLSNYLKSVSLGNEQDSYSIDENNFYYQINDVSDHLNADRNNTNNSGIVTLCFHDDNVEETVKFVAKTQYCFDYESTNNGESINVCSNRGVFITDVCGLDSPIRHKKGTPHTGIDFVPQKYKTTKLSQTQHMISIQG